MRAGPSFTHTSTARSWQSPAPASSVSSMCASNESSSPRTAAIPPWAYCVLESLLDRLVTRTMSPWAEASSAKVGDTLAIPLGGAQPVVLLDSAHDRCLKRTSPRVVRPRPDLRLILRGFRVENLLPHAAPLRNKPQRTPSGGGARRKHPPRLGGTSVDDLQMPLHFLFQIGRVEGLAKAIEKDLQQIVKGHKRTQAAGRQQHRWNAKSVAICSSSVSPSFLGSVQGRQLFVDRRILGHLGGHVWQRHRFR